MEFDLSTVFFSPFFYSIFLGCNFHESEKLIVKVLIKVGSFLWLLVLFLAFVLGLIFALANWRDLFVAGQTFFISTSVLVLFIRFFKLTGKQKKLKEFLGDLKKVFDEFKGGWIQNAEW